MREIKFELRYDNGLPNKIVTLAELANGLDKENGEHLFVTARQYTGLIDKNGVEIYEGDVVKKRNGNISEVRFGEYCFTGGEYSTQGIGFYLYTSEDKGMFGQYDFPTKSVEVIGNIYQNPELLQ